MSDSVLIVGAGVAGLSASIALGRRGVASEIVERSTDWRWDGAGLFLCANGLAALDRLGVGPTVRDSGVSIRQRRIETSRGRLIMVVEERDIWGDDRDSVGISRSAVLGALRQHLGDPPIHFGTTVQSLRPTSDGVDVTRSDGIERTYRAVIGADGHRSSIREMVLGAPKPRLVEPRAARWLSRRPDGLDAWTLRASAARRDPVNDLWVYDVAGEGWTQLEPAGDVPAPRFGHNAAFDAAENRVVVFGGQAGSDFFDDVWAYDVAGGSWSELGGTGGAPQPRYGAGGAFDPSTRTLHVSHGFTNSGRFDDTWTLDLEGAAWTDVSPGSDERPVERCLLRCGWDGDRNRLVLFGGQSNVSPFHGDLWSFDVEAQAWREIAGEGPSPRNLYAAFTDGSGGFYVFGGRDEDGDQADLWRFDLAPETWSLLSPEGEQPRARCCHDAVYLPGRNAALIFGGRNGGEELDDVWLLELG